MSYKAKLYNLRRVLFPRPCLLCRRGACIHSVPVCKDCIEELRAVLKEPCRFCGLPAAECICTHNKDVRFLLWYELPVTRKLIAMLKYNAKRERVEFLADRLAALCTGHYDGVTYVPRRPKEKRLYGYGQTAERSADLHLGVSRPYPAEISLCIPKRKKHVGQIQSHSRSGSGVSPPLVDG